MGMAWKVLFHDDFADEVMEMHREVRREVLSVVALLEAFGPGLGRPRVDTLHGSDFSNMKEMRFSAADGEWRVAFDPKRRAVVLVAGDKSGVAQKRFYKSLISTADERMKDWLKKEK